MARLTASNNIFLTSKNIFRLPVYQAVLQQEGVLEKVRRTLCTAVLRLEHPGHRHVVVLQVGQ